MADASEFSKLGSNPIPGEAPAGASVKYDPDFEKLTTEIAKLESTNPDVQWSEVLSLAQGILSSKAKDLLVSVHLAAALLQREGYPGLANGLVVIKEMTAAYWEGLFPEMTRMRGRLSALNWLVDRVEKVFQDPDRAQASESDRAALEAAIATVQAMSTFFADKFEGEGPGLPTLERCLRDKIATIPAPSAEPGGGGESSSTSQATETAPAQGGAMPSVTSPEGAREFLTTKLQEPLLKAAEVLRQANPADPLPYRVLRTALWWQIFDPPSTRPGGHDADFATQIGERLKKRDYPGVLNDVEWKLITVPLWLDLNLWAVRAMEGMGYAYESARKGIGDDVASFVRRVPQLLEGSFESGAPFAAPPTRVWIQNELLGAPAAASGENRLDQRLKEARALVARQKVADAVRLLQEDAEGAVSRRDRFLMRLQIARLCMEGGKVALALPLLESLDGDAQKFMLEEWEPGLCAEVVQLLWRCLSTSTTDTASAERIKKLYARLSSLDVSAALALDGNT